MRHPARAAVIITLVFAGIGGCSAGPRPDAQVAAMVEREDRRLADERRLELAARAASALASAGEALAEIASVDVAADGLLWGPLYVPGTNADPKLRNIAEHREIPPEPPQGWPHIERFHSALVLDEAIASDAEAADEEGITDDGPGNRRRKSGNKKPKVRVDLLRLRMNGNPVSFSGSLKGFKGVQLKATIKM